MLQVGIVCMAGCLKLKVLIAALNGRAGRQGGWGAVREKGET